MVCLAYAHRTVPLATVGVLQVGQPALSVTWAWLIVGEQISMAQVPGMALVILGQALFVTTSQRTVRSVEAGRRLVGSVRANPRDE